MEFIKAHILFDTYWLTHVHIDVQLFKYQRAPGAVTAMCAVGVALVLFVLP